MKSYEQLLPHFASDPGLEFVDQFLFSNNSIYRGQMKRVDEAVRQQLLVL